MVTDHKQARYWMALQDVLNDLERDYDRVEREARDILMIINLLRAKAGLPQMPKRMTDETSSQSLGNSHSAALSEQSIDNNKPASGYNRSDDTAAKRG